MKAPAFTLPDQNGEMKSLSDHAGKKVVSLFLCLCLVCVMLPGCSKQPTISGTVAEVEKNGHARLDITIEDFEAAGFALGDVVTVKAGRYRGDMPYLNGYYVDSGEYMLRAYPGQSNIAVCINYGKFAESAGIAEGDRVKITLSEKAGALTLQEISNLVYTNDIEDYGNNETTFANYRPRVLRICLRLWPEADRNVPGVLPFYENHEVANSISFHN